MEKISSSDYIYNLLSDPLKSFAPTNAAIKGDLLRYGEKLDIVYYSALSPVSLVVKGQDVSKVKIEFLENFDVTVEITDNTEIFNRIQIFITENRNHIEFVASNVNYNNGALISREESEYVYDPESKKYYIYYAKKSNFDNFESSMTQVYDESGIQIARNINMGPIADSKQKRKTKRFV